jgi:hypothetical protein
MGAYLESSLFKILCFYQLLLNSHLLQSSSMSENIGTSYPTVIPGTPKSVVHKHLMSGDYFCPLLFSLLELKSPRIRRLSLRMLRTVLQTRTPANLVHQLQANPVPFIFPDVSSSLYNPHQLKFIRLIQVRKHNYFGV